MPEFDGAGLRRQLSDGPTNASWLVEGAGACWVLRLDKPAAVELGLDRVNEAGVIEALVETGLAPGPVFTDLAAGVLLRPYIEGRSWTARDLQSVENLALLGPLLRRLHAVRPVGKSFEPLAAARRYARAGSGEQSARWLTEAAALQAELDALERRNCLCHNDLVAENILGGPEPGLIDWEYAAVGDPMFDLAVVLEHHGLGAQSETVLLESYLLRAPTAADLHHLRLQRRFYQALLGLWRLATTP